MEEKDDRNTVAANAVVCGRETACLRRDASTFIAPLPPADQAEAKSARSQHMGRKEKRKKRREKVKFVLFVYTPVVRR